MLVIAQVLSVAFGVALMITAIRWIKTRPSNDPALDRLFFLTSPIFWFLHKNRRK